MTSQDLPGALRIRNLLLRIAADDDLDQTAKLFAFCLAAYLASPERAEKKRTGKGKAWSQAIGEMMVGTPKVRTMNIMGEVRQYDSAVETVRRVIANDIPRYEVPCPRNVTCPVPKTRGPNTGKPCGKNATTRWVQRDPETGEGEYLGYCTAHMTRAAQLCHQEAWRKWEENGKPSPPANRGGILSRYFNTDWAKLYAWADPHREPLPNGKPPTPPRPTFTLIQGGAAS